MGPLGGEGSRRILDGAKVVEVFENDTNELLEVEIDED